MKLFLETLPTFSIDLIDELDKLIPHRCPDPADSDRAIWVYAGKRKLIDFLLALKQQEEEDDRILVKERD